MKMVGWGNFTRNDAFFTGFPNVVPSKDGEGITNFGKFIDSITFKARIIGTLPQ